MLYLVSEEAPTRIIIAAGAGAYSIAKIVETDGAWFASENQTPEGIADNWEAITSPDGETVPQAGFEQTVKFLQKATASLGIDLSSRNGV